MMTLVAWATYANNAGLYLMIGSIKPHHTSLTHTFGLLAPQIASRGPRSGLGRPLTAPRRLPPRHVPGPVRCDGREVWAAEEAGTMI